ncbi:unnamed protein product [Arabidopsis halleri]
MRPVWQLIGRKSCRRLSSWGHGKKPICNDLLHHRFYF